MNHFRFCIIVISGIAFFSCQEPPRLIQYVDPLIGTAASTTISALTFGEGTELLANTFPAIGVPHGLTNWTPQTRDTEKKCLSPYYFSDSLLQGFRASRWMSGSCTQDYGSMTLMPVSGMLRCTPQERASLFTHGDITPAYYSVYLDDYKIFAEMTGACYTALFRFRFDEGGRSYIIINPNSDEGEGYVEIDVQKNEVRGYNPVHRIYQGWGKPAGFSGHFIIRFDKPFTEYGIYENDVITPSGTSISNKKGIGVYVGFDLKDKEVITAKAGTSFTGIEGAVKNMEAESPGWDFARMRSATEQAWEKELATIEVSGGTDEQKTIFYTALYHSNILPRTYSDQDGTYPAFASGIPVKDDLQNYYCDFSMWDVYRATLPLSVITNPGRSNDFVRSLIRKYESGGWLPIFPAWNSYTGAMIGDHCSAFIGDCYVKGIRNYDVEKAYQAMRQNAFVSVEDSDPEEYKDGKGRRALISYLSYGYIPLEDSVWDAFHRREQVSRTLEYAYDDFVLSQVALSLGKTDDYHELIRRASNFRNIIDPETGWARGRYSDGRFVEKFDPSIKEFFITEGTPRHYTWYVPHDPAGLMSAIGGRDKYINRLDSMFTQNYYWHGNEPSHQVAFMFNYAGEPWKTQQYVRNIMHQEYSTGPGGLCGNEDAGQMSSWYVFAAMGIYPVCPGIAEYVLVSPSFPEVKIHLSNGKTFTIKAHNASDKNIYIQSAKMNGKPYHKSFITHDDIMSGATFEFVMADTPEKNWASGPGSMPFSMSNR